MCAAMGVKMDAVPPYREKQVLGKMLREILMVDAMTVVASAKELVKIRAKLDVADYAQKIVIQDALEHVMAAVLQCVHLLVVSTALQDVKVLVPLA